MRLMVTPGVSIGTRIMDCCRCFGADGSVLPMKMAILHRGSPAPDVHHLWPLMTYQSPSRMMRDWILVASEEATSGSVMAKQERILPSSSGVSQRSLCSGLPYRSMVSILPVSGAEQLKTSDAIVERPITSHSGAYSRLVSPAPCSLSGRNRFHRPSVRAIGLSCSTMAVGCQRSPSRICSWYVFSFG